jgi:hypothetical protein
MKDDLWKHLAALIVALAILLALSGTLADCARRLMAG